MNAGRVLVVDDEEIARENLAHALARAGYEAQAVGDARTALAELARKPYELLLTDLKLGDRSDADGIGLMERARKLHPALEVVVMTGYATIPGAVDAMNRGAFSYLAKPLNLDEVRALAAKAIEKSRLRQEVQELRQRLRDRNAPPLLVGKSPAMAALLKTIARVAPTASTVLLLGETGTGKELVARTVHQQSQRAARRFLAVNCGAFSEELLAGELFGHEKGAYTGATERKAGLFEAADGGTLFLDEVGEMTPAMQVRLLRVLQERKLMRVGGTADIPVDVRVIAATNKDLAVEAEAGTFRLDLFYRLNVITLRLPALGERREDIPLLSRHFLVKYSDALGREVRELSPEALALLLAYPFPGNIRELENLMERAVVLCDGGVVEPAHLPPDLRQGQSQLRTTRHGGLATLEENERQHMLWVLEQCEGNKTRAAEVLGIDRASLWRKLKRAGLS
ncbi:DNA-binding transcriptional response regulator, NtrC family, contains REC, AAA-type ATPase, and a Fis-type DNA-binding domains [Humidesulfovibrio mexicanus]|uniref:DNA-binding transcriptional response regulator, NtrC family, contains REC, AAA-type ATPase, and a Fis-type DNA-binding domains n=1 Tax=Humidesulfovibrio mexicanus TaxID=147047 RepID=A0A239BPZ3_9BACT|nr:sigma-54 dependent transcriptional regulator [Humidesulfovibrio mexicanus]SNS10145.1 DNA-binding transcriptional response regulator, NtrC family, contains REC, AAA-type ATPase, and a Fis-type DNA-binding domains [Humidesulfovibrio mexicanus]